MRCVARTFVGMENMLAKEIRELGIEEVDIGNGTVVYEADLEGLYLTNYNSRFATSIIVPIASNRASSFNQLYAFMIKIRWDRYLNVEKTYSVKISGESELFDDFKMVESKVIDAISDNFQKFYGSKPKLENEYPDIRIDVNVDREFVNLGLDSSGLLLSKRGYRKAVSASPMNTVLAAGLVELSGWDGKTDFVDPMCGSGTIPIEAYMKMCNIPAGYCRMRFGFQDWYEFDKKLWKKVKEESNEQITEPTAKVLGSDVNLEEIEFAKKNIQRLPNTENLKFETKDFFKTKFLDDTTTFVISPPFNATKGVRDILGFFKEMGAYAKKKITSNNFWVFTGTEGAFEELELEEKERHTIINLSIPCNFHKFELNQESE